MNGQSGEVLTGVLLCRLITVLVGVSFSGSKRHKFGMFSFLIKGIKVGNSLSSDPKRKILGTMQSQ